MINNLNKKEINVKKRLFKMTLFILIIIMSLFIFSSVSINLLRKINKQFHVDNIHSLMNEYKLNIDNQLNSDIEKLISLSYFLNNDDSINIDNFVNSLKDYSNNGDFVRISYYLLSNDYMSVISSNNDHYNKNIADLRIELKNLIQDCYTNKVPTISEVYFDYEFNDYFISYSVPIFNSSNEIVGVLSASRFLDVFFNILDSPTIFNKKLNIDWINSNGEFISWSKESLLDTKLSTIYDSNHVSDNEQLNIKNNIENNAYFQSSLSYKNKDYDLFFIPLKFNNWYLIYLDKLAVFDKPVSKLLDSINLFTALIVITILILLASILLYIKNNNKELMLLAYSDKLTGAYNFEKFSSSAVELLSLNDKQYSFVTLNIRHFQFINTILGTENADLLLIYISEVLNKSIHSDEVYCRYNADQFYLLLHATNKDELLNRVSKIVNDIIEYINNKINMNYPLSLYSGIAIHDETFINDSNALEVFNTLIYRAEFTQKHIEEEYESSIVLYDENMHKAKLLYKSIEMDMLSALENEEFKLFLQPKMDFKTNIITSAEALVRWIKDDGSVIYPDEFIPVFEKNGFCTKLDIYMLEKAFQKIRSWIDNGKKPIPISVNQTKLLFYQADYIDTLSTFVNKYNIPKKMIVLEFTESLATDNIDDLNKTLSKLKELGFVISLDDFGSGYSSLNILSSLNIDEVKFDRVFLQKNSDNDKYKSTIMNLVNLSKDLSLSTVMEGVESKEDELFLKEIGCNYGQGYFYSKPISSDEFDEKFIYKN